MAKDIWKHVQTLPGAAGTLAAAAQEMDATVARLVRTSGKVLVWAPLPSEPGPVCPICSQSCLALLGNPRCEHAACEDCWRLWVEAQLPHCRGRREADIRCIGAGCRERAVPAIWDHTCTQSASVRGLEATLAKRRRLQANVLYPPEMQVECPRAECLGLAYRGFDTLMCFLCEHQWTSGTDEAAPVTIGDDVVVGLQLKQCPSCGEHIMKNGGCDHMTCRCKYEFWWSTLLPYRR